MDHDPPAKAKAVPLGILVVLSSVLGLFFGTAAPGEFWGDALQCWWQRTRSAWRGIRTLVIYLDNGPDNSGRCRRFLKRMIGFADWSGLTVHLVYYPPYHSKYNPIERCWSALQKKWNGMLLNCWPVILGAAQRMTWRQRHPTVVRLKGDYPKTRIPEAEWKQLQTRLERSPTLPKYDITIRPKKPRGR